MKAGLLKCLARSGSAGALLLGAYLGVGCTGDMGGELPLDVASPDVTINNVVGGGQPTGSTGSPMPQSGGTAGAPSGASGGSLVRPSDSKPAVESDFSSGGDGWTMQGGAFASPTPALWNAGPGTISGTGGGPWYFHAPDKFLGDLSAAYGGVLKLRYMRQKSCSDASPLLYLVVLSGGGFEIRYFDGDKNIGEGTILTPFTLRLDASAPWYNTRTGLRANEVEMRAVLSDLEMFQIYGQRDNCVGASTLDYVRIEAP